MTETPRKGSSASSVVIRNAVVPNQRTFQVPPRPRTASFTSLARRAASRREYTKAAKYQAEKKAATTRTTTSLGSVSATAGEPHGATKGLGSCRKNLTGGRPSAKWGDGLNRASRLWKTVKEILWGLFVYDLYTENMKMRIRYNDAVNLLVFSEQLGIPLMNSYVSMRLLPYFVGDLEHWKRRELRERDFLDDAPDLH